MKNEASVAHLERHLINDAEHDHSTVKVKKRSGGFFKYLSITVVSLVALFSVANLIWKYTGSNQWELVEEKDGVKVYSLKTPGMDRIQIKGVVQVHSTLSHFVRYNQDPDVCKASGCIENKVIERVDDQLQYNTFRYNSDYPFRPREYVIRAQFHQNPLTKEVLLVYAAAPDKLPPNSCCFRVTDMNNTWRFTPLGNGLIEVEQVLNMSEGEFTPDWWGNKRTIKRIAARLATLQDRLDKKKYEDEKFDFIKEK